MELVNQLDLMMQKEEEFSLGSVNVNWIFYSLNSA